MFELLTEERETGILCRLVQGPSDLAASQDIGQEKVDLSMAALSAMEPVQRQSRLISHLRQELAIVLGLEAVEIDPQESLNNLGFDSLMILQLKQSLELGLAIELPLESLTHDPNLFDLSAKLLLLLQHSSL